MVKLFLADLEVDLTDVINIPLNKTFEDLANPTNINNEFSKTIKVPVSVHNNQVLGHAFRLDRVVIEEAGNKNIGKWLNPTKKIPFRLLNNGEFLMDGYAKLSLADYSEASRFYTINLFGTLGDIFHKLLNVAVSKKFCPELEVTEIFDESGELQEYAIPFDKSTSDKEADRSSALESPDNYIWRDKRYLLEDYLSGDRRVSAQYIKECWESPPILASKSDTLEEIARKKEDFRIVGFMPSHHGFPDNFDPKAYEFRNYNMNYNETGQFVDDLDKKSGTNTAPLVGDGITEEQFQQFVSWQQKPYIYINKLIALFQKHMENNKKLFDNFELEVDKNWKAIDDGPAAYYKNPYWSNLCYTFDFLFNQDVKTNTHPYEITNLDNNGVPYNVEYRKTVIEGEKNRDTIKLGLRTDLSLNYQGEDEEPINAITLDGYACIAWPMSGHPGSGSLDNPGWKPVQSDAGSSNNALYCMSTNGLGQPTNVPQLFFSHYHKRAANRDVGYDDICNGGYRVTIDIFDEENPGDVVFSISNAWAPLYLGDIKDYKDEQTFALWQNSDGSEINGQKFDIVNETRRDFAAVLLHRTFEGYEVDNGKLVTEYADKTSYYIGIGFPLRSFGQIPVGIRRPRFRVTIDAMSTSYNTIKSNLRYCIGCYTRSNNSFGQWKYDYSPCNIDANELFPYTPLGEWTPQEDGENYTTMFFMKVDTSRDIVKFGSSSTYPLLDEWLRTDSDDHSSPSNLVFGGLTWANGYGRYSSLATYDLINSLGADALQSDSEIDKTIKIGDISEQTFNSILSMRDDHHSPKIKLENLWAKEEGMFNIILEYSKIFGLFWDIDYVHKKIRLLSRFTYFKDYTIEDWSDKVDYNKDFQITPILHSSKYLNFDYDDEKDAYHYSDYKQDYLVNYGGYRLKTGYDFTPDSEDLFKGVQSSCFSNRGILTYNQIANYRPEALPFVTRSPFTMLDADNKDGTRPIAIENWVFRNNADSNLFTENEKIGYTWQPGLFQIIDDTPVMTATQKYMYIDTSKRQTEEDGGDLVVREYDPSEFYYRNGYVIDGTTFPSFSVANGLNGCLFAAPMQDFTYPPVVGEGVYGGRPEDKDERGVIDGRYADTDLQFVKNKGKFLYDYTWRRWMDERYNINNKKLTCYVKLNPTEFQNITPVGEDNDVYFANFKIINNQLYILNKIMDYNAASEESVKCEFVQISDVEAYKDENLIDFPSFYMLHSSPSIEAIGNVFHFPNINTQSIQNLYTDYYYAFKPNSSQGSFSYVVYNKPTTDTSLWISSSDRAASFTGDSFTVNKKVLETAYSKDFLYSDQAYLYPYFTWFIPTNNGDEKEFKIVGERLEDNNRASLSYAYKNIQAKFYGNMQAPYDSRLGSELLSINRVSVDIRNNLGLTSKVAFRSSFYEIPLHCYKDYDGEYSETGAEKNDIINVIIPTENHCVTATKTNINHARFNHSELYDVYSLPMYDYMRYNPWLEAIKNDVKEKYGYDTVEILKDADGNEPPINLFTTVVWALDGGENPITVGANSYDAAYNAVNNVPTIYAGSTAKEYRNAYIGDVNNTITTDIISSKNAAMFFGNGRYNLDKGDFDPYDNYRFNVDTVSGITYIIRPIAPSGYYNTEGTAGQTVPTIGKSRILDLYNYNVEEGIPFPFLLDPDTNGDDGYVYATYYQPLLSDEGRLIVTGNFPTEADPENDTKINNITFEYEYGGKPLNVLFIISVYCTYDDDEHDASEYREPYYDWGNNTLEITPNDTGSGRTIHFVVSIPNSNIKWETTIYQSTLIAD